MKHIKSLVLALTLLACNGVANATNYWPTTDLTDWKLYINNGVAYIESTQIADHCNHDRAMIPLDGTPLNEAIYSYALTAFAMKMPLSYVTNSAQTDCVIYALSPARH